MEREYDYTIKNLSINEFLNIILDSNEDIQNLDLYFLNYDFTFKRVDEVEITGGKITVYDISLDKREIETSSNPKEVPLFKIYNKN